MKKAPLIPVLCIVVSWNIQAQTGLTLTTGQNTYRAGDELQKQQIVFRDPGSNGKNLIWDFRHLQAVNEEYKLRYFIPDSTHMNCLCGLEHRTRYYYDQTNDSLWATGYENSTTYMKYVQPELRMRFPFTYGDTLRSEFEGKGEYGRRLQLGVKGFTRAEADAEGELILPDETVKKALRVRTLRHYTETDLGNDAVSPSPRGEGLGVRSEMILDTYSWYAQGVRYPVFESIKTSILKGETDTTVFTTSFYYPPIEQRQQNEEELTADSLLEGDLEGALTGAAAIFTEADLLPNPVVDILYVNYKLIRDAQIRFSVHNNAGVCMIQTTTMNQTEGYHSTPVNMTGCMTGVYTLYVHVDNMVMSLNVVKR